MVPAAGVVALLVTVTGAGGADKSPADDSGLEPLVRVLAGSDDTGLQRDVLQGMCDALQGRRHVREPAGWPALYRKLAASADAEVRDRALVLAVLFGDPQALEMLRRQAADPKAPEADRRRALEILVEKRAPGLLPLLRELLADRPMRGPALRGLAACDDPGTPALILRQYASLTEPEKADAVSTLASRPAYALALLEAVGRGQVPRRDLSPFIARQVLALGDARLTDKLNEVWGSIRRPAQDRAALLVRYKALATPDALKNADRSHGRLVFSRTCAACHLLFGEGARIGPELTGSQRGNPEYILSKVLDPNAVVARDYQVTVVTTTTGRVITGLVKQETEKTITLQTPTEVVRLPMADIEDRRQAPVSLMPEGQLAQLTDDEIRDLLAYLGGPGQVPLRPPAAVRRRAPGTGSRNGHGRTGAP
jgi:putative heme-binding domain-containing protein